MSPKVAMAPIVVEAAAEEHQPPGPLPGGAAAGAGSPDAKRNRAGVEPLSAFNAVHQRQDQVDDSLAKLRTELNAVKNVQAQMLKEGVGADVVANLKLAVQALRAEIQGQRCG